MSKTPESIYVNFCTYPTDKLINLGEINTAQLNDLLDALKTECDQKHYCISTMSIKFSDTMFLDWWGMGRRSRDLNLSNMFDLSYTNHRYVPTFRAPCLADATPLPKTAEEMTRICANNLRCGKCRDEYIRKTLGATLFPEYYANEKQK